MKRVARRFSSGFSHNVCSHFARFIARILVFIKARSLRSLTLLKSLSGAKYHLLNAMLNVTCPIALVNSHVHRYTKSKYQKERFASSLRRSRLG